MESLKSSAGNSVVLLVGNGPNRVGADDRISWGNIVENLEEAIRDEVGEAGEVNSVPFPFRVDRLKNYEKKFKSENQIEEADKLKESWENTLSKISELKPGIIHRLLADFVKKKDAIVLTTNYDYTMESVLDETIPQLPYRKDGCLPLESNLYRHHGKVWHIHGEAKDADSIVMSRSQYVSSLKNVETPLSNDTWLHHFLNSEVIICGFDFGYHEMILWEALALRCENVLPKDRKPIRVFLFFTDKDEDKEELRACLKSFDVEVVLIPVPKVREDYRWDDAWFTMFGKLYAEPKVVLQSISYKEFQLRNSKKYIVATKGVCSQNDERCWMNIPLQKLDDAIQRAKKYVFDCFIDNSRFCFYCDAKELRDAFVKHDVRIIDNEPARYSFYIDYRKGILYAKVSPNDAQKVIELKPFENQEQYNNIYEQTKF